MREIKFKVWDKSENQMARGINELLFNSKGLYGVMINHMGFEFKRRLKDVELLEYTGLKDKNGKEIYEGDILEHYAVHGYVISEFGMFSMNTSANTKFGYRQPLCYIETKFAEVIGNIHENPELLKGE